jgi:uncharacterized protein
MSGRAISHDGDVADLVAAQLGRSPRDPWRVAALCLHGYPTVIVSPSLLSDGTPFPTYAWLTCPHLVESCFEAESAGGTAEWDARTLIDSDLAGRLDAADAALREARLKESGGEDPCEGVGLAGQTAPFGTKCLHAHVALALVGIADPIGESELDGRAHTCKDARCASLLTALDD